jgi:hypothetical protein
MFCRERFLNLRRLVFRSGIRPVDELIRIRMKAKKASGKGKKGFILFLAMENLGL